jgi:hypothetical protein
MTEIFAQINQMSDERFNLYRLAARQHLTAEQHQRLNEINNQLPVLWDQYRREAASQHRVAPVNDRTAA